MNRLDTIFSVIKKCTIFADIGCDHGYISYMVAKNNLAEKIIISDISKKCLQKAEKLLYPYILEGKCVSVVSNGFEKIDIADEALIAGMGGEEIISILEHSKFLSQTLILQPMKNVDKVRMFVTKIGYKIERDFCFYFDGIFYDLIVLSLLKKNEQKDELSPDEIMFGRDNIKLKNNDFLERIKLEKKTLENLINSNKLNERALIEKKTLLDRINRYDKN